MQTWIAVAFVCGLGACTGEDSSGGPFVAVDQIQDAYRAAECQHLVACHELPDQATCLATNLFPSLFVDVHLTHGVLAGTVRYNGAVVARCFAQLAASSCNLGDVANRRPIEQCLRGAFAGTLGDGVACTTPEACASAVCGACTGEDSCCANTCTGSTPAAPAAPLPLGAACQLTRFDPCAVGTYCALATGMCTALEPAGTHCTETRQCGDRLQCDVFGTQTCLEEPHAIQPCPTGLCGDEGTYCGSDQICHLVALAGQSCAAGEQCTPYAPCNTATGLCTPYPATNEDCSQTSICGAYPTRCSYPGSRCTPTLLDNAPCTAHADCLSQYCDPELQICAEATGCPIARR